jgi:hypothetical protein
MGKNTESSDFFKALKAQLDVCRSTSRFGIFEALALLTAGVLETAMTRSKLAVLADEFELDARALLGVVLLATEWQTRPSVWTSTWINVIRLLIARDESVGNAYRKAVAEDAVRSVDSFLDAVETHSQLNAPNNDTVTNILFKLGSRTKKSVHPAAFTKALEAYSSGGDEVRDAFAAYRRELSYLTVRQVEASECVFRHRRLWLAGPAGSGKTILAIEIAFRHLRAGHSVLFAYRSTQFKSILLELLEPVAGGLHLLSHAEFIPLLKIAEECGTSSDRFEALHSELIPSGDAAMDPVWDLVIIDDWNQSDVEMRFVLSQLELVSLRSIILSAPDQEFSAALSVDKGSRLTVRDYFNSNLRVDMTVMEPPCGYHVVELDSNLRNARHIARYIARVSGRAIDSDVNSSGYRRTQKTTWDTISEDIVGLVQHALELYDAGSIRILCDPHLYHPSMLCEVIADLPKRQSELAEMLDPLAGAILKAAGWSGLNEKSMRSENGITQLESMQKEAPIFAYSAGLTVTPVEDSLLRKPNRVPAVDASSENQYRQRVDAHGILDAHALEDPFRRYNMVMIYDASLFIGLEADMVIYVRNRKDLWIDAGSNDYPVAEVELIARARKEQHLVGMTRAKHHLVDMIIGDD